MFSWYRVMLDRIPVDLSDDAESLDGDEPMELDSSLAATPLPPSSSQGHIPIPLARQSSEIIGGSVERERLTGLTGLAGSLMRSQSMQVVPSPSGGGETPLVPNKEAVGGAAAAGAVSGDGVKEPTAPKRLELHSKQVNSL